MNDRKRKGSHKRSASVGNGETLKDVSKSPWGFTSLERMVLVMVLVKENGFGNGISRILWVCLALFCFYFKDILLESQDSHYATYN